MLALISCGEQELALLFVTLHKERVVCGPFLTWTGLDRDDEEAGRKLELEPGYVLQMC